MNIYIIAHKTENRTIASKSRKKSPNFEIKI